MRINPAPILPCHPALRPEPSIHVHQGDILSVMQGRDANRNLQRAIKVQKVRDKLPGMIQQTYRLLAEWYQREGQPFMYDGQDYQVQPHPLPIA